MSDSGQMMVLTHKCRLQPTAAQHRALERVLDQQRLLYNSALEERIDCYQKTGKSITVYDQAKSLTVIRRDDPAFAGVQRRIQRGTLDKLDRSFKAFFRRAKAGDGASSGFPKFKGRDFFNGFHFDAPLQITFDGKRIRFAGMAGGLRVSKRDAKRLPKPLFADPKGNGNWKGIWFKRETDGRDGNKWTCGFQCVVQIKPRVGCGYAPIGVDWGTSVLFALSTGEVAVNPRPGEALAKAHARTSRAVARKKKGSQSRRKARRHLQAVNRRIANKRKNHLDKASERLVRHFGKVAVEDLSIKQMTRSEPRGDVPMFVQTRRNREALDAAPYLLRQMIAYKAQRARCGYKANDPVNSTQECSGCGALVPKELADMVHTCTACSLVLPRKVNAARVILNRAGWGPGGASSDANRDDGPDRPGNTGGAQASSGPRLTETSSYLRARRRGRQVAISSGSG